MTSSAVKPGAAWTATTGAAGRQRSGLVNDEGAPMDWVWAITTIPVLLALLVEIGRSLRRGDFGLDIVAALSMGAALVFGEELAAAVVALMYAGGRIWKPTPRDARSAT